MMTQRRVLVGAVFLALCLASLATFSCSRSARDKAQQETTFDALLEDHLASRCLRSKVENIDGQQLATVRDLLIDRQDGRVVYAVLASGGFIGLGKRLKAVPAIVLSSGTAKNRVVALDIRPGAWERAPRLGGPATAALADPAVAAAINRYYASAEATNHAILAGNDTDREPIQVPTPVGRQPIHLPHSTGRTANLETVRDFPGQRLSDQKHERLGTVHDLLVDVSGRRPSYAIVSVDPVRDKDETFAVPMPLLHAADHHGLTLDANGSMFEQAPCFDAAGWLNNRLPSGTIFRFGKRHGQ